MRWTVVFLDERVEAEMEDQPVDIRVRLDRVKQLIEEHSPKQLPPKYVKHIEGSLWELRLIGRDGITRALYVTAVGQRLVIVRVFTKKTQKTPLREIKLAQQRAKDVE